LRFAAEANDPENAGLDKAKELLAPIHDHYSWLSVADLWILAGYVAIEAAGGPRIRFAYGRKDFTKDEAVAIFGKSCCPFGDGKFNPNGSRLPAADLGPDEAAPASAPMAQREAPTINAMRSTFARMGLNDRETVALILLGHQFGRCHQEVSGYEGPWWAWNPATWNSERMGFLYCAEHFDWEYEENPCSNAAPINPMKQWPQLAPADRMKASSWTEAVRPHPTLSPGKRQYDNTARGRHIMMLISDMCLTWDASYRQHLQRYQRDRVAFRKEAINAWKKLTELGCDGLLTEEA
jgi:catalase (peroxidase I)